MSNIEHKFYEQANYLLGKGYMPGQYTVEELAEKLQNAHLAHTLEKRRLGLIKEPGEDSVEDGVSVTVLDSRVE